MILGDNNLKMSKSKGNVVNPDTIIESHGADSLRLYEMFMGPLEDSKPWNDSGLNGARKFLDKVVRVLTTIEISDDLNRDLDLICHQTIEKVTNDYNQLKFNTAISALMIFLNDIQKQGKIGKQQLEVFLLLLNPIAPHITEELNSTLLKNTVMCANMS